MNNDNPKNDNPYHPDIISEIIQFFKSYSFSYIKIITEAKFHEEARS